MKRSSILSMFSSFFKTSSTSHREEVGACDCPKRLHGGRRGKEKQRKRNDEALWKKKARKERKKAPEL